MARNHGGNRTAKELHSGPFRSCPKTYEFRLPTFLTGIASFQDPYLISGWFMGSHGIPGRERQTSSILNICSYLSGFPGARFRIRSKLYVLGMII
jgi:hypothetical protein